MPRQAIPLPSLLRGEMRTDTGIEILLAGIERRAIRGFDRGHARAVGLVGGTELSAGLVARDRPGLDGGTDATQSGLERIEERTARGHVDGLGVGLALALRHEAEADQRVLFGCQAELPDDAAERRRAEMAAGVAKPMTAGIRTAPTPLMERIMRRGRRRVAGSTTVQ